MRRPVRRPTPRPNQRPRRRARGLRDLLQDDAGAVAVGARRDVAEREHADQVLLPVEHRHAADAGIAHLLEHVVERLVLEAGARLAAHHLLERRVGRGAALGDAAHDDVAVGDHADEAIAFAHRHHADVELLHRLGGPHHRVARRQAAHAARHHFGNLRHGVFSFCGSGSGVGAIDVPGAPAGAACRGRLQRRARRHAGRERWRGRGPPSRPSGAAGRAPSRPPCRPRARRARRCRSPPAPGNEAGAMPSARAACR